MMKLVAATHNKGKLAELEEMLGDICEVIPVSDFTDVEPEENGGSFEENARAAVTGRCLFFTWPGAG